MGDVYLSSAEEKAIFFRICPRSACPEFTIVTRVFAVLDRSNNHTASIKSG
jgi:hypothetical protein